MGACLIIISECCGKQCELLLHRFLIKDLHHKLNLLCHLPLSSIIHDKIRPPPLFQPCVKNKFRHLFSRPPTSILTIRSLPKAKIRLYDFNLFKTVLLVIYITNLYRRKISTFILSKDEILVKKMQTSLHERKTEWRQSTLILIFCVDVHMGLPSST